MRSLKTIQKLSSLGSILSKIAFILSVVGFCGCIAGLIGLRFGSDAVLKLGDIRLHGLIANEYGRAAESVAAALCGWLWTEVCLALIVALCVPYLLIRPALARASLPDPGAYPYRQLLYAAVRGGQRGSGRRSR